MELNQVYMPSAYPAIDAATRAHGFDMASDIAVGALLRTLAAAKPAGRFLELGTGSGLSTSWILDGMDEKATLESVDNDKALLDIAGKHLGGDGRLTLHYSDGGDFLHEKAGERYDYIFADTWHGKYLLLEETLEMLNRGGMYIVDDMLPQPNWPEGHAEKANQLTQYLRERDDLAVTRLNWASGVIIAVKQ